VIAVLDDEGSVRNAVVRVLRASGFGARGFASGSDFLRSWHFDRPDCLVLDLQMPDMSGAEVQQALHLAGAKFPVIIISAHDAPSFREECMHLGAVDYLCKPMDILTLIKAVTLATAGTDRANE
jgi:FixJ family two-component response regulator